MENSVLEKVGALPGTLVHIGEEQKHSVEISMLDYNKSDIQEHTIRPENECPLFRSKSFTTWMHVNGVHNVGLINEIGQNFGFHSLLLEDVVNTLQRPKMEDYEDCLFLVIKRLSYDSENEQLQVEQISCILGEAFLFSFSEKQETSFDPVKKRILKAKGKIRKRGSDYLLYALFDFIVDEYFILLDQLDHVLESLEEAIMSESADEALQKIYQMKKVMTDIQREVKPLKEVTHQLSDEDNSFVEEQNMIYFRDVQDHLQNILDELFTQRERLSGLVDLHLSLVNNKTNEVMKTLAIIATFFLPLTFIAGVYGMNFKHMPETEWLYGYPTIIGAMTITAIGIGFYIKHKKWW